ncbi:MAG: caspase family protein [Chitinophagaceae bacterium]|nr:caspase family protein [Chitinophagaceae bacterium]
MKKIFFLLWCLFVSIFLFSQTKRALIIAIGNYPQPQKNGWPPINSLNDVPLIKETLIRQGFKEENIIIITDAKATKRGIINGLDQFTALCRKDDIAVIHISAHGQQLEDDNLSEETDGLDECIVPYGAIYSSDKSLYSKFASGYIRDDILAEKITLLRNRLGKNGDLLINIDACHSATGTRTGSAPVRGSNSPMISENFYRKKNTAVRETKNLISEHSRVRLQPGDASSYVIFSGAQAKEKNYECLNDDGKFVGSLTYSFCKVLNTLSHNLTYRSLFARMNEIMQSKAPRQKPAMEGDGVDREIFGGRYITQEPYFTIQPQKSNSKEIVINGGTVSGITVGSLIYFYPAGTQSTKTGDTLATGLVTSASNFYSVVTLNAENPDLFKKNPWAFIVEKVFGNEKVKINTNYLTEKEKSLLQDIFGNHSLIELGSNGELFFSASEKRNGKALRYGQNGVIFEDPFPFDEPERIRKVIKRFELFRYFTNLQFYESGLTAKVELVFLDSQRRTDYRKLAGRTRLGKLELQESDEVYLKVINTGQKDFFINIIDIQPDGYLNPILPNKKLTDEYNNPTPLLAEDCFIKAGDSVLFENMKIKISPPFGEELFKVFLSAEKLDLEDILIHQNDNNSQSRQGILNNLAKIFLIAQSEQRATRSNSRISTTENGTIFGVPFSIVPAQ